MGRPWSLALPLLYCCCWGLGAPESPAGSRPSPPGPLVQTNGSEILAVTPGVGPSYEEGSQTRNVAKTTSAGRPSPSTPTSVHTPTPASTIPEAEAGEAENASPSPQSTVLTKIGPSRVSGASTPSTETPAARSSPSGTAPRSDSREPAVHVLCTEDSSEEVQVALAPASAEAQGGSVSSETTAPARDRLASTIIHEGLTHCDIIEIEAAAPRRNPHSGPSTPGGTEAWSALETPSLPESPEAKSQPPGTHTSPEDWSTATTTPSPTVAGLSPSKSTRAAEGTTVQAPTLGGTRGTLSTSSLEETTRSEDSLSSTEGTGASVGFLPGDRAAVTEATSPEGSSATSVYSPQGADASTRSSAPGNSSPDSDRQDVSPVPSDPPTVASSSAGPTAPLTKSTDSASSGGTDAAAGGQPPTPAPTSAPRKWTPGISPGEDAGFLLLRLSVVSWENLLDPRVAERLMQQLRCELNAHMPLTQLTLLRVTRT